MLHDNCVLHFGTNSFWINDIRTFSTNRCLAEMLEQILTHYVLYSSANRSNLKERLIVDKDQVFLENLSKEDREMQFIT